MPSSFDYFDKVYCIHLPNPARRKLIEAQFSGVGIGDVTYLHANTPNGDFTMSNMRRAPRGEFGANLSHIRAVVHAIADGAERPLFFEDDVVFAADAPAKLAVALESLPADWDVIYMGGHPREAVAAAGKSLVKVGRFSFAESYAISRKSLLPFYDYWLNRITRPNAMYDFVLGEYASAHNGYCVYPLLTAQAPGVSQICGRHEDKSLLVAKGWTTNLAGVTLT